jgi:hypothetical protein
MSQEVRVAELRKKSQQLLKGSLKHVAAAGLAAALLPLGAVKATAATPGDCASAGFVCGTVFNDLNHDGIQQVGEPGLSGVAVTITDGANSFPVFTDINGFFRTFEINYGDAVQVFTPVPTGFQVSPALDCLTGVCNGGTLNSGFSVITTTASNTDQLRILPERRIQPWNGHDRLLEEPSRGMAAIGRFGRRPDLQRRRRDLVDQQGRQGQEHDDVRTARRGQAERRDWQRFELHRADNRGSRQLAEVVSGGE